MPMHNHLVETNSVESPSTWCLAREAENVQPTSPTKQSPSIQGSFFPRKKKEEKSKNGFPGERVCQGSLELPLPTVALLEVQNPLPAWIDQPKSELFVFTTNMVFPTRFQVRNGTRAVRTQGNAGPALTVNCSLGAKLRLHLNTSSAASLAGKGKAWPKQR